MSIFTKLFTSQERHNEMEEAKDAEEQERKLAKAMKKINKIKDPKEKKEAKYQALMSITGEYKTRNKAKGFSSYDGGNTNLPPRTRKFFSKKELEDYRF